ncbi:hypothetical protein B0H34DRAFT_803773 [Crassisporium funariophilum]|nr:hypothetical protein B0H34DRAFT_803773 [Crassisporium funariophilum]
MPLLGGLFSRKNKSKRDDYTTSIHSNVASELDSTPSPTASWVTPDKFVPSQPNARNLLHPDSAREIHSSNVYPSMLQSSSAPAASSHKLRLFGRKKTTTPGSDLPSFSTPNINSSSYNTPPRPVYDSRNSISGPPGDAGEERRLRPPPSRSAIFAAYGDPNNALSTRSLPNDNVLTSLNTTPSPSPSPQPTTRKPSFFPWSKTPSSSSVPSSVSPLRGSNVSPDLSPEPTSLDAPSSFNLKSFRHVRPPSPPNASNVSLPSPTPRPRGASVNSESSQRISVAAFREAQARRSLAGSPSPSFRSPSPAPALPPQAHALTPDGARARGSPRPSRSSPHIAQSQSRDMQQKRRSGIAMSYTSDSEDSTIDHDDDLEDRTVRQRPTTQNSRIDEFQRPTKGRAKSEIGHGQISSSFRKVDVPMPHRVPKSDIGHSLSPNVPHKSYQSPVRAQEETNGKSLDLGSRSQPTSSQSGAGLRQRASASTSALTPSAAAKRASVLASANSNIASAVITDSKPARDLSVLSGAPERSRVGVSDSQRPSNGKSKQAPSSDTDSEDDAPLATLLGPRRPGSAMSSYSNLHSRSTGNVSARSKTNGPPKPLIDIQDLTGKRAFTTPAGKSAEGFTKGRTLLSEGRVTSGPTSPLVESPVSASGSGWNFPSDERRSLTSTIAPVKFISPPGSPAKEFTQFLESGPGRDVKRSAAPGMNLGPTSRDSSPEQIRDPLNDRLSRALKKGMVSTPSADVQTPMKAQNPVSARDQSSAMNGDDPSDTSRRQPRPQQKEIPSQLNIPSQRQTSPVKSTPTRVSMPKLNHSPVDPELAQLLGTAGINFISRTGDSSDDTSESESEDEDNDEKQIKEEDRIAPIPIKQRAPPPAFSVTSRPPFPRGDFGTSGSTQTSDTKTTSSSSSSLSPRPRSITLIPTSSPSASFGVSKFAVDNENAPPVAPKANGRTSASSSVGNSSTPKAKVERAEASRPPAVRQRSSTMITGVPLNMQTKPVQLPEKPFAARRDSPASSTGDSSSGRAPLTPRDGSEIGAQDRKRDEWSGGASGLGVNNRTKRRSVSFEEDLRDLKPTGGHFRGKEASRGSYDSGSASNDEDREERRRERRRSEAKAAIELGNVINGPGPIVDDEEDNIPVTQNMNPRMSTLSPMMAMGNPVAMQMGFGGVSPGWGANMGQPMLSPAQFMMPPPADPNFFAAHQQAMMIAKQAYQMAVAQQAMAAAGDEWERGSAVGGYGGGGGGGSVYGGSSASAIMSPSYGMMPMMQNNGWASPSSVYLPSSSRSMYGGSAMGAQISSSRSDYGGGGGGGAGNWNSSRSSYGESFGPPPDQYGRKAQQGVRRPANNQRDSGYFPPVPPMPASQNQNGRGSPDPKNSSRSRVASQPASPTRSTGFPRKAPPPSSWKQSGV